MKKIYFFSSLFLFFTPSVNSTPEVITEYMENYSEVIELIMEKNNVDIENRGLYEFSFLKYADKHAWRTSIFSSVSVVLEEEEDEEEEESSGCYSSLTVCTFLAMFQSLDRCRVCFAQ